MLAASKNDWRTRGDRQTVDTKSAFNRPDGLTVIDNLARHFILWFL